MEPGAGDGQRQEAKHSPLQGIEGCRQIKGDGDHKQADREVHERGMDRHAIGEVVVTQQGGQLLNQRVGHGRSGDPFHHTNPARVASTTGTVCSP